ncbi:hypothetical protein Tco_1256115 [Tanacetum coccineum]
MDDPGITMEEYIHLEAEKVCRRSQEFNWETATYGKVDFDFEISFDESDDEDNTFTYDRKSFSYKLISVNDLKLDSGNDDDKIDIKQSSGDISIEPLPNVEIDNPNITMEEYIELEAENARMRGQTFNWETTTYGKVMYREDIDYFKDFETDFPAIVYKDALASDHEISSEPKVNPLDDNEIDFKISFNESDDEDYTFIYDEKSFSYKLISINNLKTDSQNDNDNDNDEIDLDLPCAST